MLKFLIATESADMEKRLKELDAELVKKTKGMINSSHVKIQNGFELYIQYPLENRIYNKLVEKELRKAVSKLDPDAKVSRLK